MKKQPLNQDDLELFRDAVTGIKPLKQDTLPPASKPCKKKIIKQQSIKKNRQAGFYFSDDFEPVFPSEGPMRYRRDEVAEFEIKQLRRGDFYPELVLDLHGLNKDDAKVEIAALIEQANKEQIDCICIVHGIGERVLKRMTPRWLVQHPKVRGFHQAPLEWGGNGALLIKLDIED